MKKARFLARLRLFSIYLELGYIPWRKPPVEREKRRKRKEKHGVYMGAKETIPFLNEDSKRTIVQLLLRPGYLMRDYIQRGRHEHFLAPLTALIVFYTVFSLALSIARPGIFEDSVSAGLYRGLRDAMVNAQADSTRVLREDSPEPVSKAGGTNIQVDNNYEGIIRRMLPVVADALIITRLDLHPEAADTPWKQSLAAFENNLRGKGIPLFLNNFIFLWLAMAVLLRKRGVSFSGAAAASAYFLCQYCVFLFLVLLFSWGGKTELGLLITGLLLFVDYRQWLGLRSRPAFWLTVKTGVLMVIFRVLVYLLLAAGLLLFAYFRAV